MCVVSNQVTNVRTYVALYFLREIRFQLRFGCVSHEYLDQGVRLEWRENVTSLWQPIGFYTYSTEEVHNTLVEINQTDPTKVVAEALLYTSTFPLLVLNCQDPVTIITEVCDESLRDGVYLRWMQRYTGQNVLNIATWSLDDIKITLWDGECSRIVFEQDFNSAPLL